MRVAREADARRAARLDRLASRVVARRSTGMCASAELRDVAAEVRQAPGDGDAEPGGRRRRTARSSSRERVLELGLRRPRGRALRVDRRTRRGDELVVERRDDDLDAVVLDDAHAVEQVLLGRAGRRRGRARRRAAELVDELVDARGAERAPPAPPASSSRRVRRIRLGGGSDEHERARASGSGSATTFGSVSGGATCSLTRVERAVVAPGVEDVPLVGVLVDGVDGDADSRRSSSCRCASAKHGIVRRRAACRRRARRRGRSASSSRPG